MFLKISKVLINSSNSRFIKIPDMLESITGFIPAPTTIHYPQDIVKPFQYKREVF